MERALTLLSRLLALALLAVYAACALYFFTDCAGVVL